MGVDFAVETVGLKKTFRTRRGRRAAVDGLDLRVPTAGVHGFLGPNGSGKTTTIRILLGLVRADSGAVRLFDREVPRQLNEVIGRVAAVVENPKFDPLRSGYSNLALLASSVGLPRSRVGQVLEIVELTDRGRDRFRTYSLGMKQRLAVAATLLKNPDLLIFDEPTNGLDPAGIRDTRQLIRALGDQGHAVLISSHLLAEIEQVADTVTIVARGRALYDGSLANLTRTGSLENAFLKITEGVAVGEMGDGSAPEPDIRALARDAGASGLGGASLAPDAGAPFQYSGQDRSRHADRVELPDTSAASPARRAVDAQPEPVQRARRAAPAEAAAEEGALR
jgi:ABC-2 type transport system ATP-binding protein